jgi:5'(3')-deoxyribonucleotidase
VRGRSDHGAEWQERLVFTLDKTIIKGDYLIDDDPTPATRTAFTIHVV